MAEPSLANGRDPLQRRPIAAPAGEQLHFERLISDLSAVFIALPPQGIDGAINDGLARIVLTLGIDRSTLHQVFPFSGRVDVTHSIAMNGVVPIRGSHPAREVAPWSFKMVMANKPVVFERVNP